MVGMEPLANKIRPKYNKDFYLPDKLKGKKYLK